MKHLISSYKICLILLILSNGGINISGQATGDPREDFLYGEFYLSQALYQKALPFYLSSLENNPENSNINYRIGLCYSKLLGEQHLALCYLKKAVLDVDIKYLEGRYNNPAAPIESWLLLGEAYHRENDLKNASYAYNKYLEFIGNSDKEKFISVRKKIESLGISYDFQRTDKNVKLINLGSVVNSRFSDYNPVVSGDQKTIIYTQFWDSYDRIMLSNKIDNRWSVPVEINDQIGSQGNCYTTSLSFKGDELFLINMGNFDIYYSKLVDNKWSKMEPVKGKINTKQHESSASISADGNFLYFSSDRSGGEGGFDIYVAVKDGDSWSNVKNLGKAVNTGKDEEAPFITHDGTVLYFSSNGHETIGNMDILYSELDSAGNWKPPINLGCPINTTNDDLFYEYFKNTQTGYLSRDLTEGFGKNDIYQIVQGDLQNFTEGAFQIANKKEANLISSNDIPTPHNQKDSSDVNTFVNQIIVKEDTNNSYIEATNNQVIVTEPEIVPKEVEIPGTFHQNIDSQDHSPENINFDTIHTYTIQLLALKQFKNVQDTIKYPLVVSPGKDGLYRYTTGLYQGWSAALPHLEEIRENGFFDAFIVNIDSVSNYSNYKK